MKRLRSILFVYCLVAVLACAVGAVYGFVHASGSGRLVASAAAEVAALKQTMDGLETKYNDLESEQRENRANDSLADMVRRSFQVQLAKQDFEKAQNAYNAKLAELDKLREQNRRQLLLIVPLIALGMLHGIAAPIFYVKR